MKYGLKENKIKHYIEGEINESLEKCQTFCLVSIDGFPKSNTTLTILEEIAMDRISSLGLP